VLTNKHGIVGAAYASSARMLLDFILLHIYSTRKFKVDLSILSLIIGAIIPVALSFYISGAGLNFMAKAGTVLLLIAILTLVFWMYVFDENLRSRIKGMIGGKN